VSVSQDRAPAVDGPGFDDYVAWYSWATAAIGGEPVACHAAAAAAMHALAEGHNYDAAAAAGRDAAASDAALERTRAAYGAPHRYVEWLVWARTSLGLPDARSHEAAAAAVQSIAAGGTRQNAADAATRLVLPAAPGAPEPDGAAAPEEPPAGPAGRRELGIPVSGRRLLLALALWPVASALVLFVTFLPLVLVAGAWFNSHEADITAIGTAELYVALLAALMLAFGGPAGLRDRLGFRFTSVGHLLLGLPVWFATLIAGVVLLLAFEPLLGQSQSNVAPLLRSSFDPLFVAVIVPTLCLLAPACEEMLFRGALYGWLRRRAPVVLAVPVTAALFAGAHLLPPLFPFLFAAGVSTALVRERTGSTLNSFVVHAAQNTFAVAATYYTLTH